MTSELIAIPARFLDRGRCGVMGVDPPWSNGFEPGDAAVVEFFDETPLALTRSADGSFVFVRLEGVVGLLLGKV